MNSKENNKYRGEMPAVYSNGQRMTIARYPNTGYMKVSSPLEDGDQYSDGRMHFTFASDRASNWENATDAWVFGYWYYDWSDQSAQVASVSGSTITTVIPSAFGVRSGQEFYIYNLLEELDAEGEWFYDKATDEFYFYPPEGAEDVTFSFDGKNTLSVFSAEDIQILGLNIENSSATGIVANDTRNLTIEGCNVKNATVNGITVSRGYNANIKGNTVSHTGQMGISVGGGDEETLTACNHVVSGNEVFDVAEIVTRYVPNLRMSGVGISLINNKVYNAPHSGITFGGNDNLICGNEIYNVLTESADSGAIYCGRSYIARGNKIENNYIHDISTTSSDSKLHAIYLDDCFCGTQVLNNIIENVKGSGVFINGGRDNTVTGNTFDNTNVGVRLTNAGMDSSDDDAFKSRMDLDLNWHTTEPYLKYGEALTNVLSDHDFRKPKNNIISGNKYNCITNVEIDNGPNTSLTVDEIRDLNTITD